MLQQKQFPHIRITHQAYEYLKELIPVIRVQRGTNVSMTDIASEHILAIPMPMPTNKGNGNGHRPQVTVKEDE